MTAMREKKISQFAKTEYRAWPRINCDLNTDVIVAGKSWPCRIIDVGELSFGIISGLKLQKGDIVEIADPRTKAQAVWVENGRAGLTVLNLTGSGPG